MKTLISRIILCLSLAAICCAGVQAQKLSAEERKIVSYIDAHQAEAIAFLEKIVNIESPTENLAGVRQVGMAFKQELDALGMAAQWLDMPPEMKRAGHLAAETSGLKGKRVLLIAHIDTVLKGEKFRRDGARAYGTGISDMKGGAVVLLYALKALHAAGALKDASIKVMYTGDEENAGQPLSASRGDMVAMARKSDLALSFEPAIRNTATVGRRGASTWTLEVAAKTGHSGQIFREQMGSGAIFEASRILHEFYEALHTEKYLTFNPSVFVGGTTAELKDATGTATGKSNVVPAKVIVKGDLRFISEEQKATARARMQTIVAHNLPGTTAKITFEDGYPAMTPTAGNYELLKKLNEVSRDLGSGALEALDPADRGAGDIGFISHMLPALDGIGGASGGNSHAPGEWAELEPTPMLIKRAALLIYRLTR
ncbi:MAG: M20/M25/M40 family metallo-hydrolase [Blastocatellia bacterium]